MKDIGRKFFIVIGIFYLIGSLLAFLGDTSPSTLLNSILGSLFILNGMLGMSKNMFKDYGDIFLNKSSYLSLLGLTMYTGSILTYIYIFKPAFVNNLNFYIYVIFFVSLIIWVHFVYKRVNKYQKAVEPYENALKINPYDVTALNNKGTILAEFKAYSKAVKCFDKVLEIDPKNVKAWYNKGNALQELGDHQKALEYYNKTLELDPDFKLSKKANKVILGS